MRRIITLFILVMISACTAVTVIPFDASLNARHVCIQDNPRVTIGDFVQIVRDGFQRHGISTEVITNLKPTHCEFTLTYTARRSWDIATYLSIAELVLMKDGREVARANYHLRGKGGLALNKWASTKSKMDPVIDELLAQYKYDPNAPQTVIEISTDVAAAPVSNENLDTTPSKESNSPVDVYSELLKLDDLRERGILTDAEFESEKRKLLERN